MSIPPSIELLSEVAAASSVWRIGGQPHVTAALKATFSLVPDGPMVPASPVLLAPDELVPFLPVAHLSFVGLGYRSAGRRDVRLALFGDEALSQRLVDRRIPLPRATVDAPEGGPVDLGPEPDGPSGTHCLGRIPVDSIARRTLLGYRADAWAAGGQREIDADFDWRYFDAVVPAQRCRWLQGSEWLLLEGLLAEHPTLKTALPGATPIVRVSLPSASGGPLPLELRADMLAIDGERGECSIVWRGSFALPDDRALGAIRLFASLELPGGFRVPWPTSIGSLGPSLAPEASQRSLERAAAMAAAATDSAAAPPGPPPPAASPSPHRAGPALASAWSTAPRPAAVTPAPAAPAPRPAPPAAPPAASLEELFTGTVSLTDRDQIELATKAPTPFGPTMGATPPPPTGVHRASVVDGGATKRAAAPAADPNNDGLFETCTIDAAEAQRALSQAATPFAQRLGQASTPPKTSATPATASTAAGPPEPGTGAGPKRG